MLDLTPRGVQVTGSVTHLSQRGQQAAAIACHGKHVSAVKGMQLELQIKHSKIFSEAMENAWVCCLQDLTKGNSTCIHTHYINCSWCHKTLKKKKNNFRENIFFNPDDLLPCQYAKVSFAGMSMAFTQWVWLYHTIVQNRRYEASNTTPGHHWNLASARESKRFSTGKLTSSEKFSHQQPDKNWQQISEFPVGSFISCHLQALIKGWLKHLGSSSPVK